MGRLPKARDVLKFILSNSAGLSFERFDGSIAVKSLEKPASFDSVIDSVHIEIDEQGIANYDFSHTPMDLLITDIQVRYKPIIPMKDKFADIKFCKRSGASGTISNFTTEESTYSGFLQTSFDSINEERSFTFDALGIRDAATAELLAKQLVLWRYKPLPIVRMTGTYRVIELEMFDDMKLVANVFPTKFTSDSTDRWLITKRRIFPSIQTKPRVDLTMIQYP